MALTGRSRFLLLNDNGVLSSRSGVTPFISPLIKGSAAITQQTPWELGGDAQMALQPRVCKDPYKDPASGITYEFRMYVILGNYLNTCCHYRSLALYLSHDGETWIRPVLNQVEYPCGSGDKANNIVKMGGGLPFKWGGKYYAYYESFGCNEPAVFMSSVDGVSNWVAEPGLMSALFLDTHFQDGALTVITDPTTGLTTEYVRGWLDLIPPGMEIDPQGADVGRTALWEPLPNFPNTSPWPPAGWTNFEVNNGHGKPDFHNAALGAQQDLNVIQFPLDWNSSGATGRDVYTHSVIYAPLDIDGSLAPFYLSINTHYDYHQCLHQGTYSMSRDGRSFIKSSVPVLTTGVYNVDPDGGYFFVGFGGVLSTDGNTVIHYYAAAKNGGKPGCANQPFQHGNQSILKATIRRDGYFPNRFNGGTGVTADWTIPPGEGSVLHLNMSPYGAASMKAQVESLGGVPIPGFTFADCVPVTGDHVMDGRIRWTGGTLQSLAGQTVRFRLQGDGDVYSMWLAKDTTTASYLPLMGVMGSGVSVAPTVSSDTPITSATLVGGSLPAGTVLNSATGNITGTPTVASSGTAQIRFAAYGSEVVTTFNWTIIPVGASPTFVFPSTIQGQVGQALSVVPTGVSGNPVFTHTGLLHPGLTVNEVTGEISGIPTAPGTYSLTVVATNSFGSTQQVLVVRVLSNSPCSVPVIVPNPLIGNGRVTFVLPVQGAQFTATGGTATISLIDSVQLPNGCWQYTIEVTAVTGPVTICGA